MRRIAPRLLPLLALALLVGCGHTDPPPHDAWVKDASALADGAPPDAALDAAPPDAAVDAGCGAGRVAVDGGCQPCPADMVQVDTFCMDRYEAPNRAGALPLVMYHFVEAEAWCQARDKRLCFDDEWTRACAGPDGLSYPYGNDHQPGTCNDEETWRVYNQTLLNGWPASAASPDITSLADLFAAARQVSSTAAAAADHVESLYQGEGGGDNTGCTYDGEGVFDLVGNVEEWTRRRDGGTTDFHGNLKGRYWAESRTCQSGVTTHGDYFRFYEIGFRCCRDLLEP